MKERFEASFQALWSREICPSFKNYQLHSSDFPDEMFNPQNYLDSEEIFEFAAAVPVEDDDDDDRGGFHNDFEPQHDFESVIPTILGEMKTVVVQDDHYAEGDLATIQSEIEAFSFFDASANNNWIGPEHWRPTRNGICLVY